METTTTTTGNVSATAATTTTLHTYRILRRATINRAFALISACAITSLLYHNSLRLLHSTTLLSFFISATMLLADILLSFMWVTTQAFRMRPIARQQFPQNLRKVIQHENDFPAIDIFICTADPYKEPPMSVVNTALSVMAYDYLPEKLSVYVSDDGGSELTLFAFMEAAKFGRHWLAFCKENKIIERCPEAFFSSKYTSCPKTEEIKMMYESMKIRVENTVDKGMIIEEYITNEQEREAFNKWTSQGLFTRQDHPTIIQVLLERGKDRDINDHSMPNLIYLSRQKSKKSPHHYKAGALNALVRVSATMTNAPIILTLDCDMYSNDPKTPDRVLCYLHDPSVQPTLAYVQFPQRFHGINKADIYASEFKRLFQVGPVGMDGLKGPIHVGTGCFFRRRAFFGGPFSYVSPKIKELSPDHIVDKPIVDQKTLALAHHVAGCTYEDESPWGSKMGFRYGSLVEDYYTGYRLQCEGWKSIFCNPSRPAFLGDVPISLADVLGQNKRWSVGLLEVAFSKYCPLTFGARAIGPLAGLCYAHNASWPTLSVPITIYAILPQLALINKVSIFPKVTDPWFLVYAFLFIGSYAQDCLDFILAEGTLIRWWSDQRMWLMRGVTSYLFGSLEFATRNLGIATPGFNVTSKVLDDEQSKRYDQGIFEFGMASPMFVSLVVVAVLNFMAFFSGFALVFFGGNLEGLFVQIFIASFGVLNCLPIYEAMALRSDKGRMPAKVTTISTFVAWVLYVIGSFLLKM